jgi:hypothetical protein
MVTIGQGDTADFRAIQCYLSRWFAGFKISAAFNASLNSFLPAAGLLMRESKTAAP